MKRLFSIVALLLIAVAHAAPVDPIGKDASGRVVPATRVLTSLLSGPLTCDVASSALPTGAATEVTLASLAATIASISALQLPAALVSGRLDVNLGAVGVTVPVSLAAAVDVSDRAARLLGVTYGSQGQQLQQSATNYNLLAELRTGSTAYDARQIRALTSADTVTIVPSGTQAVSGPLTDTQLRASTVPVSGTVTATVTGVATSANQTNGTQKTQVVDAHGNVQPAGDSVTRPIYQARVGASAFQLLTGLTSGTTLRSGVGTLRKMCVFIPSSGGTGGFYVYDNTAASGTAIVSLFTTTSTCYDLDVRFGKGLTVEMTTAAAYVLMTWDTY